jgi:hypothetical protein
MEARTYQVYAKFGNRWRRVCTVKAGSHPEALRKVIACLTPEHYDRPVEVELAKPPPRKQGKK